MWRNHQHRIPRGKTQHQQEGHTADHQKLKIELSDPHTPTHTKKKRKKERRIIQLGAEEEAEDKESDYQEDIDRVKKIDKTLAFHDILCFYPLFSSPDPTHTLRNTRTAFPSFFNTIFAWLLIIS
jgi:hypothetical protein